jgi:transposase
LTDLDKSSLLEVIDSHKSEDIITVLKQQPLAMREGVKEVCVDMWGGFPKVIREVFPNAKTVIDRFHVQKLIDKAAHRQGRCPGEASPGTLPPGGFLQVVCDKTALNKIRLTLKINGLKNRYLLMSNQANLTSEDRSELELMLAAFPSLSIAHELKEELITVYNSDITASGGMRKMKKWLISARAMFGSAADTLESHLEEICNYFTNRTTSGVTEGINTRIKLIIRQSYGFKNFDLMKEKLLACLFK